MTLLHPATARPGPRHRAGPVPAVRRARRLGAGLACGLLVVLVASVAGWLPVQLVRVGSDSMAPAVPTGSLVVVDHRPAPVARMDVVTVDPPDGVGAPLVKRAVAVGGDVVGIEDGVLVVNGSRVCEPSIDPALIDGEYFGPVTVPPDRVFLLGDNRASSIDSRAFGPVRVADVRGHVPLRIWPSPGGLGVGSC